MSALHLRRLAGRTRCACPFALKPHAHRATGRVSVWIQGLRLTLAGKAMVPNSLVHDLAVRFDRFDARQINIFIRDLHIAHIHELF